jgi:hypothetical protein
VQDFAEPTNLGDSTLSEPRSQLLIGQAVRPSHQLSIGKVPAAVRHGQVFSA